MTDEHMSLQDPEPLNDAATVGTVESIEPGPNTVEFEDVGYAVTRHFRKHAVADDDSRIFIGSDGGDLETSLGPLFDAPIVSNYEVGQAKTAIRAIQDRDPKLRPRYTDFDVLIDDQGPVVFRGRESGRLAAVTPVRFNWDQPVCGGTKRPESGPRGPVGPGVGLDADIE
jgi:hypothetical protein